MRSTMLQTMFALLLLGEAACNYPAQPGYPNPPTDTVSVQAVKVTPQVLQFPAIGITKQVVAQISPANATDQGIAWESTDTTVATVDAAGRVTARGAGAGIFITAYTHDGDHQASVNVSVIP